MSKPNTSERLTSLDAFRGATMALMVLVNNSGDGAHTYAPLNHAEWHGWTLTDTVFPSFLWIVGVAMTLSMAKRLANGAAKLQLLRQAVQRTIILYGLGLLVYAFPHFHLSTQRVLGVLQRIALCYLIVTVIYLTCGIRGQIAWIIGLLGSYWLLMAYAPVPGFGSGRLDVEGNFAHYIDSIVLGKHNYASTKTWDPEGIVSTLPSIATALFGIMAGHILRLRKELAERTNWLFLTGIVLIALGLMIDPWLPINKKLWTSSFALFMAGLDFVVFAAFVWLVDAQGYKRWTRPFVILGMNAISIYMVSELLAETLGSIHTASGSLRSVIFDSVFTPIASPYNASLLYAISFTLVMFAVAYGMHRKGWYLRA